jgi:hypothetical protein
LNYNVQGINKSTPKTYLMFLCIESKPLLTRIQDKYTLDIAIFLMKFTNAYKKHINGKKLQINGK